MSDKGHYHQWDSVRLVFPISVIKNKSMPTLYVGHSIVTHEQSWPNLRQATASGKLRLVLSVWNLFEIGSAADEQQRERRLTFLAHELCPLWVVERYAIQRQEVERFLWQHKFQARPRDLISITSSLSVVDSFLAGAQARIGLTPRQFIRETDFARLLPLKRLSPTALTTMQSAERKTLKRMDRQIFDAWIGPLIPGRGPDGRALTIQEKADLLAFCWQHKKQFFAACRCLAVEDALTRARTSNAMRQPAESDGMDLQHATVALAYCDIFYSRDGYQAQCATEARNVKWSHGRRSSGNICRVGANRSAWSIEPM
jgi:hypothetical protein